MDRVDACRVCGKPIGLGAEQRFGYRARTRPWDKNSAYYYTCSVGCKDAFEVEMALERMNREDARGKYRFNIEIDGLQSMIQNGGKLTPEQADAFVRVAQNKNVFVKDEDG